MVLRGQPHTPADLSIRKALQYTSNRKLGETQSRSGRWERDKSLVHGGTRTPTVHPVVLSLHWQRYFGFWIFGLRLNFRNVYAASHSHIQKLASLAEETVLGMMGASHCAPTCTAHRVRASSFFENFIRNIFRSKKHIGGRMHKRMSSVCHLKRPWCQTSVTVVRCQKRTDVVRQSQRTSPL
jgi:hypothetical protein